MMVVRRITEIVPLAVLMAVALLALGSLPAAARVVGSDSDTNHIEVDSIASANSPEDLIDQVLYHVEQQSRAPGIVAEAALAGLEQLIKWPRTWTETQRHVQLRSWLRMLRPVAVNRTATFPAILVNPRSRVTEVYVAPAEWTLSRYLTAARVIDPRTGRRLLMQIECREFSNSFGVVLSQTRMCWLADLRAQPSV